MTLIAIALALLTEAGTPYPIPPQPLRWLYRDADLVVVAKAGNTVQVKESKSHWTDAKVTLRVDRTLKGKEVQDVDVYYSQGMVCPAPDEYPEGRTVLAFLRWDKQLQGYRAPGLSYGSKLLDPATLAVFVRRLEDLAKIPEEKDLEPLSAATLEWLVRCMELPVTRWEGAQEFTTGRRRWDAERERSREDQPARLASLTDAQRKRLVDAFVMPRELDYGDMLLADLLKEVRDDRIPCFLANHLRYAHARGELDSCSFVMSALNARLNLPGGRDLLKEWDQAKDDGKRVELVGKFLDLIEQQ